MSRRSADRSGQDPRDEGLLALVRSLYEAADPVPAGLVERDRFLVRAARPGGGSSPADRRGCRGRASAATAASLTSMRTGSRWRVARPRRAGRSRSTAAT